MAVVYIGLIMTSLMLWSFSFLPGIIERIQSKPKQDAAIPAPAPANAPANAPAVAPEIIAVITTVLEAEFQKMALLEGKFTFKESAPR